MTIAPKPLTVAELAAEVIGSPELARDRLVMPAIAFEWRKPRDMLATAEARRILATLLEQIRDGAYI
jgi:uncharacterized protein (DUF2384 family)